MKTRAKTHSVSVIYKITNRLNGMFYIGSSKNLHRRTLGHEASSRKEHPKCYLHKAIKKYGIDNFDLDIVENVKDISKLFEREQHWIDTLKPFDPVGYNLAPFAGSRRDVKHSEESKKKMSESAKGKIISQETRNKIGDIHRGVKKSEEQKRKISIAHKIIAANNQNAGIELRKIPIYQIDELSLQTLREFSSIISAARFFR